MQHTLALALLLLCATFAVAQDKPDFYVSPQGNDTWSGKLPAPNAKRTDGPVATLERASIAGAGKHVILRGGTYALKAPLALGPASSHTRFEAYAKERPVISGGRRLTGFKPAANGLWTVTIPEVKAGTWTFRQLWVNGERRRRPRLPKEGWYALAGPNNGAKWDAPENKSSFRYKPGDLRPDWTNLDGVEVVLLQYWTEARLRIKSLDEANHLATFTGPSWRPLNWAKGYVVDNVREALDEPGQWYLDRHTGVLTYWPIPGEDMTKAEVIAPVLEQLVRLEGTEQQPLVGVTLRGLRFAHTAAPLAAEGHAYPQAEIGTPDDLSDTATPAAVLARHVRQLTVRDCEFTHLGVWGLEIGRDATDVTIAGNRLHDLGCGGMKIGRAINSPTDEAAVSRVSVTGNEVCDGNRVYMGAPAIWVGQSGHNTIARNVIHGPWEWAISVGWTWEYQPPNPARDNIVELNHIYGLGESELGTHATIYCLGLSPGTVIRRNLIHDISGDGYGIILDQGCAGVLVEDNIVHHSDGGWCSNFHCIGNIIMNNIFALTRKAAMHRYGDAPPGGYTLSNVNIVCRNIFYFKEGRIEQRDDWLDFGTVQDWNLFWDPSGRPLQFLKYSLDEWRAKGLDRSSIVADPLFADPEAGDFTLAQDSPVFKLGFRPLDLSDVPR